MMKNLLILLAGAGVTVLVLGLSSGVLTSWVKTNINTRIAEAPSPTPSVAPVETIAPTSTPKVSATPEPTVKPTSKGGIVLGEETVANTPKPVAATTYSHATVVYEYKAKDTDSWQVKANYDTRYESYIDFDEVSSGFDRKVTVCLYNSQGQIKCESGKVEPAVYNYKYVVGGKKLVYEIVADQNGPTMKFEGPWKNSEGKTCVRVYDIADNLTPTDRLVKSERMDSGDWRQVHSEYCLSGNAGDKHSYQVRVKDERGNETTSTFTFPVL